jgi:lipopolysaccharide export system protein LptA
LRLVLLGVLAALLAALGWALVGRPRPASTPLAELPAAEGVTQRALRVDFTRTRRGLPAFRVGADEALTYEDGTTELHQVLVTVFGAHGERTEVASPLARSAPGGGGWSFSEGVEIRGEDGLRIRVPEIRYREGPQEVTGEGDVAFERAGLSGRARGLRHFVARRRLEFLADVEVALTDPEGPFRRIRAQRAALDQGSTRIEFSDYAAGDDAGRTLEGRRLEIALDPETRRPRRILADGGFVSTDPGGAGPAGGPPAGARTLSGSSLTVDLLPAGAAERLTVRGSARLVLGPGSPAAKTLASEEMVIEFAEGRPASVLAEGSASLEAPAAGGGGEPARLSAARIRASVGPDGALRSARAEQDAVASGEGRTLRAPVLTYDAAADSWTLTGTAPEPARVESPEGSIAARRIEIRRADGSLAAEGDVKTATRPRPAPRGAPAASGDGAADLFGAGSGPIHGMSGSLTASRGGRRLAYRGRVRLWRGGGSLEASEVDVSEEGGAIEARGSVVARMPARGSGSGAAGSIVTVEASEMRYARGASEAVFSGKVRAQADGVRIEAERLRARGGADGRGLLELAAEGQVRLQEGRRRGEGDALTARIEEGRYELSGRGRLAVVQDQSTQQVVKGSVLTWERSAGRILVESESGGRTWITLRPRPAEGTSGGDPEPPR